ncbi:DUF397 domain-containing protein [Streptomyces rhizosphaericus]|uniref:DUF397 domain-containing protein n=1 Tax=Streptomyces rhizosphaericus TaxID=114699 RepID=A0A6G4AQS5_9ACTN|nr:DUF397 domain-containing protein [Streptomyces rhizosphaericus]
MERGTPNPSRCPAPPQPSARGAATGACIEVAENLVASRGVVPVRDSKDPHGPALMFELTAWSSFVSAVRRGEFPTT